MGADAEVVGTNLENMWHIEAEGSEGAALCGLALDGAAGEWVDAGTPAGVDCIVCAELAKRLR